MKPILLSLLFIALLIWGVRQYNVHMRADVRLKELDVIAEELVQKDFSAMLSTSSRSKKINVDDDIMTLTLLPDEVIYVQEQYTTIFQQAMHEHYQKQVNEQEAQTLLESFHAIRNAHMNAALTVDRQTAKLKQNS